MISDVESDDNLIERAIKRQQSIDKQQQVHTFTDTGVGTLIGDLSQGVDSQAVTGHGLSMRSDVSSLKSDTSHATSSTFLSGQASRVKVSKKKLKEIDSPFDDSILPSTEALTYQHKGKLQRVHHDFTSLPEKWQSKVASPSEVEKCVFSSQCRADQQSEKGVDRLLPTTVGIRSVVANDKSEATQGLTETSCSTGSYNILFYNNNNLQHLYSAL